MRRIFKTEDGKMHEKFDLQPGCWIALTNPTASEIMEIADKGTPGIERFDPGDIRKNSVPAEVWNSRKVNRDRCFIVFYYCMWII